MDDKEYRIYRYSGQWYWEEEGQGHGPFEFASEAAQDLKVNAEMEEDLPF